MPTRRFFDQLRKRREASSARRGFSRSGELELSFWGAARGVTGSRHLLETGNSRILMDCGLFQGRRKESAELNRRMPFDPSGLDAVVLSHAHIDHSGNLPSLVRAGFGGKIHCTRATADLLEIMLRDSAHIQEKDAQFLNKKSGRLHRNIQPLYSLADAERTLELLSPQPYRTPFDVTPGLSCTFRDAGHILGSAIVDMRLQRPNRDALRIVFSGDLGRANLPILKDPELPDGADVLIMESTYGDRLHEDILGSEERLAEVVERTIRRGGKVIIPAFSVGRSQEIVYELSELMNAGALPEIPIFIDSPMTAKASQVFRKHQECFDAETWEVLNSGNDPFGFDRMSYVSNVEESKALNHRKEPCVIISASGMAEAGRILHHLANNVGDRRNTVLIVGYMAEHTLGRKLAEGADEVRILGSMYQVKAEVVKMHAFSAHGDRKDLLALYDALQPPPSRVFLVHGEDGALSSLQGALQQRGAPSVEIPAYGQRFRLE